MKSIQRLREKEVHDYLNSRGGGGQTVGKIAKELGWSKSYCHSVLKRMVQLEQIDREHVTLPSGMSAVVYHTRQRAMFGEISYAQIDADKNSERDDFPF